MELYWQGLHFIVYAHDLTLGEYNKYPEECNKKKYTMTHLMSHRGQLTFVYRDNKLITLQPGIIFQVNRRK